MLLSSLLFCRRGCSRGWCHYCRDFWECFVGAGVCVVSACVFATVGGGGGDDGAGDDGGGAFGSKVVGVAFGALFVVELA